jgi:predicted anti-sigma-YlaC factor YlaD
MSVDALDPRCQSARVMISSATDDEVTDVERAALRTHLDSCGDCRRWAAVAESLALRIRTADPVPFAARLPYEEPVRARTVVRRRRLRRVAASLAVGAAAAAAGAIVSSGPSSGPATASSPGAGQLIVADASAGYPDGALDQRTLPGQALDTHAVYVRRGFGHRS